MRGQDVAAELRAMETRLGELKEATRMAAWEYGADTDTVRDASFRAQAVDSAEHSVSQARIICEVYVPGDEKAEAA